MNSKIDEPQLTEEERLEFIRNKPAIKAHISETIHTFSDGTEYRVALDGSWRKIKQGN